MYFSLYSCRVQVERGILLAWQGRLRLSCTYISSGYNLRRPGGSTLPQGSFRPAGQSATLITLLIDFRMRLAAFYENPSFLLAKRRGQARPAR